MFCVRLHPLLARSSAVAANIALGMAALGAGGCGAGMFVDPTGYDSQACVEGSLRRHPHFGPAKEAFGVFQQNCFMDDGGACSALGIAYEVGVIGDPQPRKALAVFERACTLGNARGCVNLGAMLARGAGGVKDPPRAARLFASACDRGERAGCAKLGEAYRDGLGVARDEGRATDLFHDACAAGDSEACTQLAELLSAVSPSRSLALYVDACVAGDATACARVDAPRAQAAVSEPAVAAR